MQTQDKQKEIYGKAYPSQTSKNTEKTFTRQNFFLITHNLQGKNDLNDR